MSESDDDDLEGDDQLESMRAVWLSMRDEEPSDKGLAALMAAAREQADASKEPKQTFWQKLLATLRRPPVLALASVAILLGGALVIANRSDTLAVDESAPAPGKNAPPAPATPTADRLRATAAGSAAPAPVETQPAPEKTGAKEMKDEPVTKPAVVTEPPRRPVREKAPERRSESATGKKVDSLAPPPAEPPPPGDVKQEAKPTADKAEEAPVSPVTRGPVMKPPTIEPTVGGLGAGSTTNTKLSDGESVSVDGRDEVDTQREQARVLQMVKQCESAAARGDCAAVKVLAAKIRAQDAATYKARVAKNASIARCLE